MFICKQNWSLILIIGLFSACSIDYEENWEQTSKESDVTSDVIPYNDTFYINGREVLVYNPYKNAGDHQYSGQLHCHSWNYEYYNGNNYKVPIGYSVAQIANMTEEQRIAALLATDQAFVKAHKEVGYDFMTITNYDVFSDLTEAPTTIPKDFIWIGNSFEANTGGWDNTGLAEHQGAHLGIINTDFCKKFRGWTPSEIINFCEDKGCIVIYNHPFLTALYSSPVYLKNIKKGLRFIEVFNGLSFSHDELAPGIPFIKKDVEMDVAFDALLSQGNFVFCVATSDERTLRTDVPDLKMGCVRVFANDLSQKAIIESLLSGNFYSASFLDNCNVIINNVIIKDGKYIINVGIGDVVVEFVGINNTILKTVTTTSDNSIASYDVLGTEGIVRARIYKLNSHSLNDDSWYQNKKWVIWTQPLFINDYSFTKIN